MISVDAIKKSSESDQIPLQWVGMEKVTLPTMILIGDVVTHVSCDFDIFVNLVSPSKGIHMSRLYDILSQYTQQQTLTIQGARSLLSEFVESQKGLSTQARMTIELSLPLLTTTLKSEKNYFKSVPLKINLVASSNLVNKSSTVELDFKLDYSSTCPQSAALAHQLTIEELANQNALTAAELTTWFLERGFVATPHAQRSELNLSVVVSEAFEIVDFTDFYSRIGQCLGTPTQGLVKRADEQEFARLNADNLMFCEDAARKLIVFLKKYPLAVSGHGKVIHLESLHSHNAVTYFNF